MWGRTPVLRAGLGWQWGAAGTGAPGRVELPVPGGASLWVDVLDPAEVVGWSMGPDGAEGFRVVLGDSWVEAVRPFLTDDDADADPPVPPRLDDDWAEVATGYVLQSAGPDVLSPGVLGLDLALAWDRSGQWEMAALWLDQDPDLLTDLLEWRAGGRLPGAADPLLTELVRLARHLDDQPAGPTTGTGPGLAGLVDGVVASWRALPGSVFAPPPDGSPDAWLSQAWAAGRLAAAASASGAGAAAEKLAEVARAHLAEARAVGAGPRAETVAALVGRPVRTTLAEVLAVHGLDPRRGPDQPAAAAGATGIAAIDALLMGDRDDAEQRLRAARDVYARRGLDTRVAEIDQALAALDREAQVAAFVADLRDLDAVRSVWATHRVARGEPVGSDRGPRGDHVPAPEDLVLDDGSFAALVGRSRGEAERVPTLRISWLTPLSLDVRLTVAGDLDDAVVGIDVVLETGRGPIRVPLDLADRADAVFRAPATLPAPVDPAAVTASVEVTRRATDR